MSEPSDYGFAGEPCMNRGPYEKPDDGHALQAVPPSGTSDVEPRRTRVTAMRPPSLQRRALLLIRDVVIRAQLFMLRRMLGMDIGKDVRISLRAKLDFANPRGVHIGDGSYVAFDSVIFAHDLSRHMHADTYVGRNCFIGAHAIIMPGIRVGDYCIVGSGAVVTRDVPSGSIVAGNPAKIIRSGVKTIKGGILEDRYAEALARINQRENKSE